MMKTINGGSEWIYFDISTVVACTKEGSKRTNILTWNTYGVMFQ